MPRTGRGIRWYSQVSPNPGFDQNIRNMIDSQPSTRPMILIRSRDTMEMFNSRGNRETSLTISNSSPGRGEGRSMCRSQIKNIPSKDNPQSRFLRVPDCATPLQEQAPEAWQPAWIGPSDKLWRRVGARDSSAMSPRVPRTRYIQ